MNGLYGALIGAIMGMLGGLIGWGLTALIWAERDPADRPKWAIALSVAVFIALSRPLIHWWTAPSVDEELRKAEQQLPALAALRETDPSGYSEVRAIAEQERRGQITGSDAMESAHAVLMRAYQRKLPTAPDALVQVQAQVASAEYSALQGTPDICVDYIAGTRVVDLRQYLSSNMIASDQDLMARVLRSRSTDPVTVASEDEVQKAIEPILLTIASEEKISGPQIVDAMQMKGDQRLTCRVFASLFRHISELPTHQAAAVTRGIARMSQTPQ